MTIGAPFHRIFADGITLQLGYKFCFKSRSSVVFLCRKWQDIAESIASRAPAMWRIEGKKAGIEFLKCISASRASHFAAEDDSFDGPTGCPGSIRPSARSYRAGGQKKRRSVSDF